MKLKSFLLAASALFAMSFQSLGADELKRDFNNPIFMPRAAGGLSLIQPLRSQKQKISILCEPAAALYEVLAQSSDIGKVRVGDSWYSRVANGTTACFAPIKNSVSRRGDYICQSDVDNESGVQEAPALPFVPLNAVLQCFQDNNSAGVGSLKPNP